MISTRLDTTADRAWQAVKRTETFVHITRGLLGFAGARELPEEWREGEAIRARLRFFNFLPAWEHELRVVRVDDRRRVLHTNEGGGFISRWNHVIRIEAGGGTYCRYTDEIEIKAGVLTSVVWLYAHLFYRYRQMRWRRLARRINESTGHTNN
ncbi:MAG: hypothetical protein ACRD9R_08150 [Pyrinomonadaceae bacterium]